MSAATDCPIYDLSKPKHVSALLRDIKSREGWHRVEITKIRANRSLFANAFYWAVVLPCIARGMSEAWGEDVMADEAHEFCRREFLTRPIANRRTGEVKGGAPRSTGKLDIKEFGEYLDKIILFAAEQLQVEIPQPSTDRVKA